MPGPLDLLARPDLVVVAGKGGVGKTVLAAALGLGLAARGRRTVVLEVDPRESLHQVLGSAPSNGALVEVAGAGGRPCLWFQNLRPRQVLDDLVRRRLRLGPLAERLLRSPVYEHVAEGAPGLKELAVLLHARELATGRAPAFDVVVLDAPATGHALSLLAAPGLVSEVVEGGPFGGLARELAAWLADPRRCALVVATLAEEMPAQEGLELVAAFPPALGRGADLLVVNALYPPLPAASGGAGPEELVALWRERREINERELARLAAGFPGPRVELPLLPLDRGPRLLAELAARLEAQPAERHGGVG
jgi:hypothetical protein